MIGGLRVFIVIFVGILFGALPAYSLPVGWREGSSSASDAAMLIQQEVPEELEELFPSDETSSSESQVDYSQIFADEEVYYDIWMRLQGYGPPVDENGIIQLSFYEVTKRRFLSFGNGCWTCPVFEVLLVALDKMASKSIHALARGFLGLMGVGILFFLLFKVGQMMIQIQHLQNVPTFLEEIFKPLLRAMIATILLLGTLIGGGGENPSPLIYHYFLNPALDIALTVSNEMVTGSGLENEVKIQTASRIGGIQTRGCRRHVQQELSVFGQIFDGYQSTTGAGVDTKLLCWLESINVTLIDGLSMGAAIMYVATYVQSGILPDFVLLLIGLLMFLSFFVVFVGFPFKLLDTFVRLAFVFALMPLWIVLWVFPVTRRYTQGAITTFIGTCMTFIALGVVVAFILALFDAAIPNLDELRQGLSSVKMGADDKAQETIRATTSKLFGSRDLLVLAMFTFISWKLLGTVEQLVTSFVSVPIIPVGNTMSSFSARVIGQTVSAGAQLTSLSVKAGRKALGGFERARQNKKITGESSTDTNSVATGRSSTPSSTPERNTARAGHQPEVRTPQKNNRPTPAANTPSEMKEGKHRRVGAGLENVYDKDGRLLSTQRWGKKRDERGREVDDKTHRITTEYLPKGQQRITDEYGTLRGDTFVVSGRTESQKEGV